MRLAFLLTSVLSAKPHDIRSRTLGTLLPPIRLILFQTPRITRNTPACHGSVFLNFDLLLCHNLRCPSSLDCLLDYLGQNLSIGNCGILGFLDQLQTTLLTPGRMAYPNNTLSVRDLVINVLLCGGTSRDARIVHPGLLQELHNDLVGQVTMLQDIVSKSAW